MEPDKIKSALNTNNTSEYYISKLFQSRDIIHLAHLKTTSYAQHKALDEYYNGILDLTDTITESLQGYEEKLFNITIPQSTAEDPVTHLKNMKVILTKWRENTSVEFLKNHIDECMSLINQTLYKLKFLS